MTRTSSLLLWTSLNTFSSSTPLPEKELSSFWKPDRVSVTTDVNKHCQLVLMGKRKVRIGETRRGEWRGTREPKV